MTTEIELKLEYDGADWEAASSALLGLGSLGGLTAGEPSRREITDIYWDTADQRLQRHLAALRVRRCGSSWNICLKYGDRVQSGVFIRHEFEAPLSEQGLGEIWRVLGAIDDSPPPRAVLSRLTSPQPSGDLLPLITTHCTRIDRPLMKSGLTLATMTIDEVRYERVPGTFHDLEIELAPGAGPNLLELLERELQQLPGCEWRRASASKLVRGLSLIGAL